MKKRNLIVFYKGNRSHTETLSFINKNVDALLSIVHRHVFTLTFGEKTQNIGNVPIVQFK